MMVIMMENLIQYKLIINVKSVTVKGNNMLSIIMCDEYVIIKLSFFILHLESRMIRSTPNIYDVMV